MPALVEKIDLPLLDNPSAHIRLAEIIKDTIVQSGLEKERLRALESECRDLWMQQVGSTILFSIRRKKELRTYVSEQTDLPVFIDNDSTLIALAEQKFGAAMNAPNAMVINIGWGVGLGLVLKGEMFRGDGGFAGEFSHIPLFNNNKLCGCGKTGCLETETSMLVIVEKAIEGLNSGRTSILKNLHLDNPEPACNAIMDAVREGDQFAVELLSEVGYHIGQGTGYFNSSAESCHYRFERKGSCRR